MKDTDILRLGPAGGTGGGVFDIPREVQDGARITRIEGHAGDLVYRFKVTWRLDNGDENEQLYGGGTGGQAFALDLAEDETVQHVSGGLCWDSDTLKVAYLTIETSRQTKTVGLGDNVAKLLDCKPFRFDCPPDYSIIGFFGRAAVQLDAIGVVLGKKS